MIRFGSGLRGLRIRWLSKFISIILFPVAIFVFMASKGMLTWCVNAIKRDKWCALEFSLVAFYCLLNMFFRHSRYKEPLQYFGHRSVTVMSEKLSLVTCTSCGKPIPPGSESTKFLCPSCGEIQMKRDGKCRKFGRLCKCPKWGVQGP